MNTKGQKVAVLIPARMAATRFPNKPLAAILGLPMIEHVRRRVALCAGLDQIVVATCDQEIITVVQAAGGNAVMTSDRHERCTDRIAEAAQQFKADIIVNVQGDEPLVTPEMVALVTQPLLDRADLPCANLMAAIQSVEEFQNPNVVKVTTDQRGRLLYASREAIPSLKKAPSPDFPKWKQLGIIAFRADFLQQFAQLAPTPLEQIESVDMLRALEHGYSVQMIATKDISLGVDVPGDIAIAERYLRDDVYRAQYM